MAVHLATCTFPGPSGLPDDVVVNTFHFDGSGDYQNVSDMLYDFYATVPTVGGATTLMSMMSDDSIEDEMTVRIYDLSDSPPRVPVFEETHGMPGLGTSEGLPREVAICLSYQGAKVSGVNMARRRGRLFLGALNDGTNNAGRPGTAFLTAAAQKMEDLLAASIASVSWSWVVYSPTSASSTPVVSGWVDDAYDTQRRRGLPPTTRVVFP